MTRTTIAALCAAAALLASAMASAQTTAPSKPARPAAKPAPAAAAAVAPAAPPSVLPAANSDQINAAERTHYGTYDCEFDQKITVSISARASGYVDVGYRNSIFVMKPVLSSTGALRLEDVTGRTLMLQIAYRSMLLDTRFGQRLVANCILPEQAKFNAARS